MTARSRSDDARSSDMQRDGRDAKGETSPAEAAGAAVAVRPYRPADEAATIALWLRAWQTAYPAIDFAARLTWWRERWRNELAPTAQIAVAEDGGAVIGFVTVDPRTGYLDQLVAAPDRWGTGVGAALVAEAKRLSPAGLDLDVNRDNGRAIRFYRKQGFVVAGAGRNPISGRPVHRMRWRP